MSQITIPYMFEPREYQLRLFIAGDTPQYSRFFLRWCRRAGKDKTCINFVLKKALERVGAYYYIYPTYSQARKALWEGRDMDGFRFLDHIPQELRLKTNNNELKIELINGSIIRLIGSEQFDSLMGTNPLGIVFSEFALQDLQAWQYMEPILIQNGGWAVFNSTPRGRNHFYHMEMKNLTNPDWYISEVQTLWEDLPNYYPVATHEDIEKARRGGATEEIIEQEYGVSYTSGAKGNYYSDQIITARKEGRIGKYPYDDKLYVDVFADLGFRDSTSLWFKQQDGKASIFIDYYENNTKDLPHYVEVMRDKGYKFRTLYMPHDGKQGKMQLGFSHVEMMRMLLLQANLHCEVVAVDRVPCKQDAIDAVRSRFSCYYFNEPLCGEAVNMLSLYHRQWDKNTQSFKDNPVHDWTSHAADALTTEALSVDLQDDCYNSAPPKIITNFDPFDY